jgi:hypothetical protein
MQRSFLCTVFIWLLLSACGGKSRPPVNVLDGGEPMDAAPMIIGGTVVDSSMRCTSMSINCDGTTPYTCTANGARSYMPTCPAARPFCAPGAGCVTCVPGAMRCSPNATDTPQRCNSAQGWIDETVCNTSAGQRCSEGRCGDPCEAPDGARQYLGCNYWATATPNSQLYPGFEFAVVVANPNTYDVQVDITRGGESVAMHSMRAGELHTFTLPWVDEAVMFDRRNPGCSGVREDPNCAFSNAPAHSTMVRNAAFRIRATAPVAAYQFNPLSFSTRSPDDREVYSFTNDASLLLSQRALTQRYLVLTAPNWTIRRDGEEVGTIGGFIAIAAVANETTSVTVQLPPGHGVSTAINNQVHFDNMMPGDVAIVVGDGTGDLSGSIVEGSNPVAVFAGHDCTRVPQNRSACDHLEEQVLPIETLGRDYIVSALRDRNVGSLVRMVAPFDNTVVQFEPATISAPRRLRAREVLEIPVPGSMRISSSGPLLVEQFMLGLGELLEGERGEGDPAMVQEVPIQQFRDRYDFLVPMTYTRNFLGIVAPHGSRVLLDDVPAMGMIETLGPWDIHHVQVNAGRHQLRTAEGVSLGVKVYGTARYTSYMYPGGLDLRLLPPG